MDKLVQKLFNNLRDRKNDNIRNQEAKDRLVDVLGDYLYISNDSGEGVNFYPGNPSTHCSEKAYFVSLTKDMKNFDMDQSIPLEEMLRKMFKQIMINCFGFNKKIFLIVDDIDMDVFDKYKKHFDFLNKIDVTIEIIYFGKDEMRDFTSAILG